MPQRLLEIDLNAIKKFLLKEDYNIMGILDKAKLPRKICPVMFMVDTSGSMSGAPIGAVNSAMETILPELISMNDENPDAEIRVAVMSFSEDRKIQWISGENGLVKPEDFTGRDLQA